MTLLIPTIFLIAMIVISLIMVKEYKLKQRADAMNLSKESEQRFIIERKVMRDIKERAEYWDNFNIEQYVKFLESR